MHVSREDRVRMERAHVQAWPALRTDRVDGWQWRCSGGGSQRANSVSTIDFTGTDLDATIDAIEDKYRRAGTVAQFHTFDETKPSGLADTLRARGYVPGETTLTMFRRLGDDATSRQVEIRDDAWHDWLEVYSGAISESRRAVNTEILKQIPRPRAFFGHPLSGKIVSTALGVVGFGCAVIECVATRPEARRQGGAQAVLEGLLAWAAGHQADLVGLQVVAENTSAIRLYQSLGFVPGATNRFWRVGPSADHPARYEKMQRSLC